MADYICARVCKQYLTLNSSILTGGVANLPLVESLANVAIETDGSETLVLVCATILAFAIFVFVYLATCKRKEEKNRIAIMREEGVGAKRVSTQLLITVPNPRADIDSVLNLEYTLHIFNHGVERMVQLGDAERDGQWAILINQGMGEVQVNCNFIDGHNHAKKGIKLKRGMSGHFIWKEDAWVNSTVGFSIF